MTMASREAKQAVARSLGINGQTPKSSQVRNAIIRQNYVGGDAVLDAIEAIHRVRVRLKSSGPAYADQAEAAQLSLDALRRLVGMMTDRAEIDHAKLLAAESQLGGS